LKRIVIACLCVLSVLVGACSRDQEPVASPDATATSDAASATPEPTPCILEGATTDTKKVGNPDELERATVADVRPNDGGGCPRVVFEFQDGSIPAYDIGYAEPPFSDCGSGQETDPSSWDAGAYIKVDMRPAGSGDIDTGEPVYKGPNDISVDGPTLKHMRRFCDYEAVYEWVIAVSSKLPFTVDTLDDPARLVIDISES
jgi:hypothetical protein